MTDRELLELAAKAAGLEVGKYDMKLFMIEQGCNAGEHEWQPVEWNPLDDDGDALRLANKLRARIEHHIRHPFVAVFVGSGFDTVKAEEPEGDDVDAATRRAIVRAAAEIGKQEC